MHTDTTFEQYIHLFTFLKHLSLIPFDHYQVGNRIMLWKEVSPLQLAGCNT